ncbi:hypothetical protein C5N14_01815 [Micromonospora sp. MW-13]|nr:hypothetical protein C5N14_01815 [Micromonospora sp. MW-13]
MARITLPTGHEIRPRGVFCDDKIGSFTWYFDYLYPSSGLESNVSPAYTEEELQEILGHDRVTYSDGQFDWFKFSMRKVFPGSDTYDADHYRYYEELPKYI